MRRSLASDPHKDLTTYLSLPKNNRPEIGRCLHETTIAEPDQGRFRSAYARRVSSVRTREPRGFAFSGAVEKFLGGFARSLRVRRYRAASDAS